MSKCQITVELDAGLDVEETKKFLLYIIEVGSLNVDINDLKKNFSKNLKLRGTGHIVGGIDVTDKKEEIQKIKEIILSAESPSSYGGLVVDENCIELTKMLRKALSWPRK